jgi:hypothetical protein
MTSRASSCGSATSYQSACSYTSFGPRQGRRPPYIPPPPGSRRSSMAFGDASSQENHFDPFDPFACFQSWDLLMDSSELRLPTPSSGSRISPPSEKEQHSDRDMYAHVQPKYTYECTFCCKPFLRKYEWKRHEESVHVPQKEWVCSPNEAARVSNEGTIPWAFNHFECVMCGFRNPPLDHFHNDHNTSACWEKPQAERTFFRKDHLVQHVRQVHCQNVGKNYHLDVGSWCQPVSNGMYDLTCGFCGLVNETWDARAKHIPTHFEEGLTMSAWKDPGNWNAREQAVDHVHPETLLNLDALMLSITNPIESCLDSPHRG